MAKTKTNDVRVIDGWVLDSTSDWLSEGVKYRVTTFCTDKHNAFTTPATLVIGDKAMPMKQVEAMVREILEGVAAGDELTIETIAAKYGVKI